MNTASVLWVVAVSLLSVGTWLSRRCLKREHGRPLEIARAPIEKFQPISILKPLKGVDSDLRQNLESFFLLSYPKFEIIFSVADPDDPACEIVRELQSRYIRIPSRLMVGDVKAGANPKVNNLIRSFDFARFDWVLISDSNVRVKRDYLSRLALQFKDDVGVLTAVVSGVRANSLGGRLESMFLNTFYARWMYLAFAFRQPIVLGKSMMLKRSAANRFGGFKTLACYLAEDYMAGEAMRKLGYRIELLDSPVQQPLRDYSLSDFWKRHLRWGRIRKNQAFLLFCLEPWLGALPSGVLGAAALHSLFHVSYSGFLFAHLSFWFVLDQIISARLSERTTLNRFLLNIPIWLMREALAVPLWLHIAAGNTVNWRGKHLKVEYGGILSKINDAI
jgi:ceramide glucosyltransferase